MSENKYLNDGSIEQRSLCLALIRQVMSGNKPDVEHLINYPFLSFPTKTSKGFNYRDYSLDEWQPYKKIAKNIPDWPCLNLAPEILEMAIKNCIEEFSIARLMEVKDKDIYQWFGFDSTGDAGFWYKVGAELESLKTTGKEETEQPNKTQRNEIEFQRKKASILRGTVPEGSEQSSGKCKTATCIRHLGYQVCSGR